MINKDWERFGDEIRMTIQNAIDRQDFNRLNQTVSDAIGRAMGAVSDGVRHGGWYRQPDARERVEQNQRTQRVDYPRRKNLYLKGTAPKVGGLFLAGTGGVFCVACVIALLILGGISIFSGAGAGIGVAAGMLGVSAVIFAGMTWMGTKMVCEVARFRRYVKVLNDREYCDIAELSEKTGRRGQGIIKDLKRMIRKGWFLQGHLDEKEVCLMVSDGAYRQYRLLMDRMKREKEEEETLRNSQRQAYEKLSPQVQQVVKAGDQYVRKIREANEGIRGKEISDKISRIEMLVGRIFDRVEQHPDSVGDIGKMMQYYLPTTVKLLEAYKELEDQPVQGENILYSKREIEKTLDTLNTAFEKLLDDLFRDAAWDVSSDISVLRTMLAQEGLTEDGFGKVKSTEGKR